MADESPFRPPTGSPPTVGPVRLRRWFLGGFLLVFVGLLLFWNQYVYDGRALYRYKLWNFYLLEIPKLFRPTTLGPGSASRGSPIWMLFLHVTASGLGGLVSLVVGSLLARIRRV